MSSASSRLDPRRASDQQHGERAQGPADRAQLARQRARRGLKTRADGQRDPGGAEVGDHRGLAEGQKRRGDSRQRQRPELAADDDDGGHGERQRAAERQERRVVSRGPGGNPQHAPDEERVDHADRDDPGETELLADDREDQVGLPGGNQVTVARSRAHAADAARRHGPQGMGNLIAAGPGIAPGIQPDRHAARERARHAGPVGRR